MYKVYIYPFNDKNHTQIQIDARTLPPPLHQHLLSLGALRHPHLSNTYLLPYHPQFREQLTAAFQGQVLVVDHKSQQKTTVLSTEAALLRQEFKKNHALPSDHQKLLLQFSDLMQAENLSANTIKTYTWMIRKLMECSLPKHPKELNQEDLSHFYHKYLVKGGYSASFQNQAINAIKKFYQHLYQQKWDLTPLSRPVKKPSLPFILSQQEIIELLGHVTNIKHKALLSTIYACGLRVGEICALKLSDLDEKQGLVYIHSHSKHQKRSVPYPLSLQNQLQLYLEQYQPATYLFEGPRQKPYTNSSAAKLLQKAVQKAQLPKATQLHTLRHSYAAHLYENGTSIKTIQALLGHQHLKTTMIYTQVAKPKIDQVISPFELLPWE